MRKLNLVRDYPTLKSREHTQGSETSHYLVEKRPIGIPLVAASETGKGQTNFIRKGRIGVVRRYRRVYSREELQRRNIAEAAGTQHQRG